MPDQLVNLVDQDGKRISVPLDQAASLISSGSYHSESGGEQARSATQQVRENEFGGVSGFVGSTLGGLARGATLGFSDVAARGLGYGDTLAGLREENQGASLATEILGGLATGKVLPAGQLSRAGTAVAEAGEGAGIIGKTALQAGGAALEGAGQSAGGYVSQVALDNKPLSAEGFLGATGSGALLGGGLGGALGVAETTLVKAKRLFPRSQVTREAAQDAERAATDGLTSAANDSKSLIQTAREELAKNRLIVSASDTETAQALNAIKVKQAEEALKREQLKTQQAVERRTRKPRKAFAGEEGAAPGTAAPGAAEVPPPSIPSPGQGGSDDLLSQLQATKQGIDEGKTIGDLSHRRSIDDAADDLVAAKDPAHAKLLDATRELDDAQSAMDKWLAKYNKGGRYDTGEVAAFERAQKSRDYAAGMRPKEGGYYTKVPEGEGNALLPRGRQQVFRGTEAERAAIDARTMAKLSPEEKVAADLAAQDLFKPKSVAEDILSGAAQVATAQPPIEHSIASALRKHVGEHADATDDIVEAASVISRVEKAQADVAEALGPLAPPSAQARATQYRTATATNQEASAASIADMAKQMEQKLPADVAVPAPKLQPAVEAKQAVDGAGLLSKAADAGAVLEVLSSLDIPGVPNLRNLPVIGPVLSLYLKARAANAVFRRLGGKVPTSVEGEVAKRAAQTRDRVAQAVDKMLDVGAAGARKARQAAGPMAGLGTKLFDAPAQNDRDTKPSKKASPYRDYEQRMHELVTANQPGMIAEAVKKRIPTADPALQAELVAAAERKMQFLADKAPKKMQLPTILKGDGDWKPSKVQLAQFSRYIEAANDPAGVLEKLGDTGQITYEAAETLRTVYPALYQEAQKRLLERAPDLKEKLPYARRVSLSILFQVPVDGTMDADFQTFLRQGNQPAASAQPAQGSPAAAPPTPTASGPVMLGDRTMTRLDRRAGA